MNVADAHHTSQSRTNLPYTEGKIHHQVTTGKTICSGTVNIGWVCLLIMTQDHRRNYAIMRI